MPDAGSFSRREILKRLGMAGAAVAAMPELSRVLLFRHDLFRQDLLARQRPATGAITKTPQILSGVEFATLAAICARLIPSDENGPGAAEAHAAAYIDRALGGALASSREAYSSGLAALNAYAHARTGSITFAELPAAQQDAMLADVEQDRAPGFPAPASGFFQLVRGHTLQGTFCDPLYGGNADFVGWDLIGYPGVRLSVTAAEQNMATPASRNHKSAYDYIMFSKAEI